MRFAVLASGKGSNLQAILDSIKLGKVRGELALVISDKADAFALTRAREAGIKSVLHIDPKGFSTREQFDAALVEAIEQEKIGLVVLAGFMRILSPVFVRAFPGRIINIHPALLPAFKGAHAIRDALAAGVKVTGVTVHVVDEEVDHGPVLAQVEVPVKRKDTQETLAARIHKAEHIIYPQVIDSILRGKIRL